MARKLSGDVRREQIAQAALEIVAENGVSGVTIASVASKVGIAPSAVYRHLDGREGVLAAAMDALREIILGNIENAEQEYDSPLDVLGAFLERMAGTIPSVRAAPRIFFSDEVFTDGNEGSASRASVMRFFDQLAGRLTGIFLRGQDEGCIRKDIEARQLAVMFVGLYAPPGILYHVTGGTFDVAEQLRAAWRVFRQMLSPGNEMPEHLIQSS